MAKSFKKQQKRRINYQKLYWAIADNVYWRFQEFSSLVVEDLTKDIDIYLENSENNNITNYHLKDQDQEIQIIS